MPVILTAPVEGLQPGDTYTGANEAYLVASGYAKKSTGPYTGPGLDNTGPADLAPGSNLEFNATRGQIAGDGGTPEAGTNDGDLKLHDAPAPFKSAQGSAFGTPDEVAFDGFANDPEPAPGG